MTGKRPLTDAEYNRVEEYLRANQKKRDLVMVMICRFTGYRIKEVLSIRVKDIYRSNGEVRDRLLIMPRNMKKKEPRMPIAISDDLRSELENYRRYLHYQDQFNPEFFLMQSQKGSNKAISYTQAYRIVKEAFNECEVYENVAVHSFRKSFCDRVYEKSGFDLRTTQCIMGHATILNTEKYISFNNKKVNQTMETLWME